MWGGEVLEEELSTWLCKILRFINKCEELETLKWPPYWHFFDNNLCVYISYQSFQNLYIRGPKMWQAENCVACQKHVELFVLWHCGLSSITSRDLSNIKRDGELMIGWHWFPNVNFSLFFPKLISYKAL